MKTWGLIIAMFLSSVANAVEVKSIDLFIEHGMIVKNQGYGRDVDLTIHYVDAVDRVEKEVGLSLPPDQNKAAAILKKMIAETDIGQKVAKAYLPLIKATRLGIQRIPAAVINQQTGVFYGSTDIAEILTAAQEYNR